MLRARVSLAVCASLALFAGCATLLGLDEDRQLGSLGGSGGEGGQGGDGGSDGSGGSCAAPETYEDLVLCHAPVAYFRFEDREGTSTFANLADSNRAASKVGSVQQAPGAVELGAVFNGASSATVADDYGFEGNTEMSVELWVSTPAPETNLQQLVSKKAGDQNGWAVTIDNDHEVTFTRVLQGSSTNVHYALLAADYDRFLHVVATFSEASGSRLFVDGVQRGEPPAADELSLSNNSASLLIAGDEGTYFTGVIDEVALYSRELTLAEIEAHFAMRRR